MKIMVVDDGELIRHALASRLSEHEVVVECDPGRALRRLCARERFDLVLCDQHMPDMPGTDFLAAARLWFDGDAPMLVLMTGDGQSDAPDADAMLSKPFPASALDRVLALAVAMKIERRTATTRRLATRPAVAR